MATVQPHVEGRQAVNLFTQEWRRLQLQKWRLVGGVEARMLTNLSMYFGEHAITQNQDALVSRGIIDEKDKNRLNLVFNMLRRLARKRMGRAWSVHYQYQVTPNKTDPRSYDMADVVSDLNRALDYKCNEDLTHWLRIWWCTLCGVCVEQTDWVERSTRDLMPVTNPQNELLWTDSRNGQELTQSQVEQMVQSVQPDGTQYIPEWFLPKMLPQLVGDIETQIVPPLNFFIDASNRTIRDLPHDQGCFTVFIKTGGWIKENFGADALKKLSGASQDLGIVKTRLLDRGPALANMNLRDLVPAVQGSRAPGDPPFFLVATRYQPDCADYPYGRRTMFVPGQGEPLDDGEIPYPEIPLVDYHYDAPATSFWTPDFLTDYIPAQKFFNKRMSQLGQHANASVYETLLLGGNLTKEMIPSDIPGSVEDGLDENGQPLVVPLQHAPLPTFFLESIAFVQDWLRNEAGSDLTSAKMMPGQIRGPLALPLLQELMDAEDAPYFTHLGTQIALAKQQRINRVKAFYPPIRTLNYTNEQTRKDEVLEFHTDQILRAGVDFTITVDRSSLLPELSALRRARVVEDLSGPLAILYTNRRTGRLDAGKIAMAIKYTDRDTEDRVTQARKLARSLIARLWQGQQLPPNVPYPFWDHDAMLDEYDAAMQTTEWLEASEPVRMMFIDQYERHRAYLAAIQDAQMASVQNQLMQGAMAQATQQAAAKAASVGLEAALEQVVAQGEAAKVMPPEQRLQQAMSSNGREQPPARPPMPNRPQLPPAQ